MIKTNNRKELSSAFIIPYYANGYDHHQEQSRKKLLIADTIEGLVCYRLTKIGLQLL
ncbi:MAG: hypothetical protein ACJ71F_20735 [Nitrososphaeraceae archaeon]